MESKYINEGLVGWHDCHKLAIIQKLQNSNRLILTITEEDKLLARNINFSARYYCVGDTCYMILSNDMRRQLLKSLSPLRRTRGDF